MTPKAFEALDKAIEAGGVNLTAAQLGGGRGAQGSIDELCNLKYLDLVGSGSKKKYTVSQPGREAWDKQAAPDRKRAISQREQEREKQALVGFLKVVEARKEKPLTTTDLGKIPATVIETALKEHLVAPASKANAYRLLDAGRTSLLAEQPVGEQLAQLRELQKTSEGLWSAAFQAVAQQLREVVAEADAADLGLLEQRGQEASKALSGVLDALAGHVQRASVAKRLHARIAEAQQTVEKLEAEVRRFESRLRALEKRPMAAPPPPAPPAPPPAVAATAAEKPPEMPDSSLTPKDLEDEILKILVSENATETTVSIPALRLRVPAGSRGDAFRDAVFRLDSQGKVFLYPENRTGQLDPAELAELLRENDTYFAQIGLRDE